MGDALFFDAERMQEIEDTTVVSGSVDIDGNLILVQRNGDEINAGRAYPIDSTTTVKGVAALATSAETIAGTDETKIVTPAVLATLTATDTRKGLIELATSAEVLAGTDVDRGITPFTFSTTRKKGLQGCIPSSVTVSSGTASVSSDGLVSFSGCGSISLNDIFDGLGGDMYELYINYLAPTTQSTYLRLRNAGVDLTTPSYNRMGHGTYFNSGPTRSQAFPSSELTYVFAYGSGGSITLSSKVTIFTPMKASGYITQVMTESVASRSDRYRWTEFGQGPSGYSGITLSGNGTILSGEMKAVKIG